MKTSWCVVAISALGFLAGCSDDTIALSVDVRTDLSPGNEFQRVAVSLVGEGVQREVEVAGDYIGGVRVADFEGLEANESRTLRVDLLDAMGALVVRGEVLVNHTEDRGLVVVVTRDCREVSCSEANTCRGGGCVPADCIDGTEPSCPEPECRRASDCPAANACSSAQCGEGVCLYAPTGSACGMDEYCDPDQGCLTSMTLPDAGAMDAGSDVGTDAGFDVGVDVGTDAGSDELGVPRPTWPPNGAYTGAWNRQPRLHWEPVEGATRYQIQADNSCDRDPAIPCDFPSPELFVVLTVSPPHEPIQPLVPIDDPGARVRWRVRACIEVDCGAWSPERYLEVGISELDVDGDARADLVVGSSSGLVRLTIEGGNREPTPQQVFTTRRSVLALERGDFNADGLSDVLTVSGGGIALPGVEVYYGSEAGLEPATSLVAPDTIGAVSRVTCSADFDADGFRDVAISDATSSYVYWGSAAGLGDAASLIEGALATCGDVDLDGYADIVVPGGYYGGESLRDAPALQNIAGLMAFQLMGDVNEDGYQDAVMGGAATQLVLGNGAGFDAPVLLDADVRSRAHVQMVNIGNVDRFGVGHGRNAVWADWSYAGKGAGFGAVAFRSGASASFLHGPCTCDGLGEEVRFGMDLNGDTYGDIAVSHESGVYFFFGEPGGYNTNERTYNALGLVRSL